MVPAVADNAGIMLFLVILGAMVALINRAGGSAAFGRWAETHIKTRVGAMFATFLLGVLIFVDDYFNCLTVGSVMLPVTDRHKISRAKLAYLIDATAAPVCMIAPISSWAAAVSGVVEDYNGFDLFVRAIPYNFYSLLTFVFIIALILMKFDYGPMRLHEMNARFKDDLYTTGDRADANSDAIECNQNGRVIDLILPVAVLIVTCFAGLVYVGGYWDAAGDYYHDFVGAFGNTDAFAALPWGSLIALVFTIIYFLCRRLISFKAAMDCLPKGFINMVPAITILTFATSLKNMTGLLGGKYFVASVMNSAAGSLFSFLPAIIFIVAGVLSFACASASASRPKNRPSRNRSSATSAIIPALSPHEWSGGMTSFTFIFSHSISYAARAARSSPQRLRRGKRLRTRLLEGAPRLGHLNVHHRLLEACADIGDVELAARRALLVHVGDHRRLQPREREPKVARVHHRTREGNRVGIALGPESRDHRTARIPQAKRLRHLVEGLAHRIVDRRAEDLVIAPIAHVDEHGVAARHKRDHGGRRERIVADLVRVQMTFFEVVHADERNIARPRRALRKRHAHHERTEKPGSVRDRDGVEIVPTKMAYAEPARRHVEALVAHAADGLDVLAACDLGNHAAETRVEIDLRCHDIGEKSARSVDDGRRRLVAR